MKYEYLMEKEFIKNRCHPVIFFFIHRRYFTKIVYFCTIIQESDLIGKEFVVGPVINTLIDITQNTKE